MTKTEEQQSSVMVERVARAIEAADVSMVTPYETLATAALQASHHAELVEALRHIANQPVHSWAIGDKLSRPELVAYARAALAKLGPTP